MELHEFNFRVKSKSDVFYIAGIGDIHFGTKSFDEEKFIELVNWIKDKENCYWVGLGDYAELITYRDIRRFNPDNIDPRFKISDLQDFIVKQADGVTELLMPIAGTCIGLGYGNHELDAMKNYDVDITRRIAQELGVKCLGWTCLTRLKFVTPTRCVKVLIMLTEHSNFAGRKAGGKVNRLHDRIGDWHGVDILLCGHSHDKVSTTKEQLYLPTEGMIELKARKIVAGIVPSFYKSYEVGTTSYSEIKGYSPTSTGMLLIEIKPFCNYRSKSGKIQTRTEIHISQ